MRASLLTEPDAVILARRLMLVNHHQLYDLERVRAALHTAALTPASREPGTHGPPAAFAAGAAAALDIPTDVPGLIANAARASLTNGTLAVEYSH